MKRIKPSFARLEMTEQVNSDNGPQVQEGPGTLTATLIVQLQESSTQTGAILLYPQQIPVHPPHYSETEPVNNTPPAHRERSAGPPAPLPAWRFQLEGHELLPT